MGTQDYPVPVYLNSDRGKIVGGARLVEIKPNGEAVIEVAVNEETQRILGLGRNLGMSFTYVPNATVERNYARDAFYHTKEEKEIEHG